MTEFLIGAGGWAYFQVPGLRPLEAYARAFNFVEVNSTFYEVPSLKVVRSWRRRVPQDFEFSESVRNFLESVDAKTIRIVWEVRREKGEPIPSGLVALMQDYGIIHCVDLSREDPAVGSDTVYTRVFGKGEHNVYQFTDEELVEVDRKIMSKDRRTVVASFHNLRMYKDAARYKIYKQTTRFPPVTGAKGQQSLKEVLMEDAQFPATKHELIKDQGWKAIDLTEKTRVHASMLLNQLPDREFRTVDDVLNSLGKE